MIRPSPTGFDSGGTNYGYDPNGNPSGTGDSIGYGNPLLGANGYSYTYDAAGNMLTQTDASGNVTTFDWDNRERLVKATLKNSSDVIQKVVDYTYDAFNELIGEKVTPYTGGSPDAASTQHFVYDPATGQMQLAFDGSGNLTDRYLWGPLVDQVLADEKVTWAGPANSVEWIATEGSVTDVWIVGSGILPNHVEYNAFGGIESQADSAYTPIFGYDGEYTDPVTGMQLHGLRWYDSEAERFVSKDPIFPLSGSNPYEYCGNDPTSEIDPSGLWGFGLTGGGAAEIGLGFLGVGAQAGFGVGYFSGGGLGAYGAAGAFAGTPNGPSAVPDKGAHGAGGVYGGVGGGLFCTNADSVTQLSGPFETQTVNIGSGPIKFSMQVSTSGNIWIISGTVGPGWGLSASDYMTTTVTTR